MTAQFPEEYELLSFFEVEPSVLDKEVPWIYNIVTFEKIYANETLVCTFSPSYGDLNLKLIQNGIEKLILNLSFIERVEVLKDTNREHLRIQFKEHIPLIDFLLAVKPEVKIIWGTELE
jgi:hypothetical protein